MITLQFILYNLTFLLVIAHFLDSAKEKEWTDFLYKGAIQVGLFPRFSLSGWLLPALFRSFWVTSGGIYCPFLWLLEA